MRTLALLCLLLAPLQANGQTDEPFSIAILPDTQHYTNPYNGGTPEIFTAQTDWLASRAGELELAVVLHEGDLTNDNDTTGWDNAAASMSLLDGVVPYVLAVGNHDGLNSATANTALFNAAFPVAAYEDLPSFGGVFEAGQMDNSYHLLDAGGEPWLILSLEFGPRDAVLAWADQLIASFPERFVIVLTHTHVYYDDELHGSQPDHWYRPVEEYGRENNGDDVWYELVQRHANVRFVFNGHVLGDGQGRLVGVGEHGNPVFQILCNYQMDPLGGAGYLRLLFFDPATDSLQAVSYSPWSDEHRLSPQHRFSISPLEIFPDRYPPSLLRLSTPTTSELQLHFDEPLEPESAAEPASYRIDYGPQVEVASLSADGRTVTLLVSELEPCQSYRLHLPELRDKATPPNAMSPDSQYTFALSGELLSEDFTGGWPVHWTAVDQGSESAPSDWRIRSGALVQLSNIFGPDADAQEMRQGTALYFARPDALLWRDYSLEVLIEADDDDGLGVVFRWQDEANHYKLELDRQRNFTKLFRVVQGQESTLASAARSYEIGQPLALRIQAYGDELQAFADGEALFDAPVQDGSLPAGTVGLYTWGCESTVFDDLRVMTPEASALACPACPGGADDYRDCYTGPAETAGVGRCHPGAQVCHDGLWSLCLGQVLPESEICDDGRDNDCDGLTDAEDQDCPGEPEPDGGLPDGEPDAGMPDGDGEPPRSDGEADSPSEAGCSCGARSAGCIPASLCLALACLVAVRVKARRRE
ncbi:MAG: metallophosphoesterase [Deltaproteobacteria bacterium]|nr:metallophosphoesterase [Deltaproteobacteria bacterium]